MICKPKVYSAKVQIKSIQYTVSAFFFRRDLPFSANLQGVFNVVCLFEASSPLRKPPAEKCPAWCRSETMYCFGLWEGNDLLLWIASATHPARWAPLSERGCRGSGLDVS